MNDPLGIAGRLIDGKYAVEKAVGEGGAGIVYRARNVGWDLPVAIKFYVALSNAPEESREKLLAEFVQEGRLMSHLSTRSAAVVQPRDMGAYTSDDGTWLPYLVLEWLEGSPLDVVLVSETERHVAPRGLDESMRLLEPVVEALAMAHAENIAHRDIKPENMFVLGTPRTIDERLKLLDFGIAKVMNAKHGHLLHTAASATPFTPHYGAPEQFSRGYGATGPWTDVFALALVVLEVMRGGDRAFQGDDYMTLAAQSRDEEVRPTPHVLGMNVSEDVDAVFARALAVRPQDRYASAGEFWSALHGAAHPGAPVWSVGAGAAAAGAGAGPGGPPSGVGNPAATTGPATTGPATAGGASAPASQGAPSTNVSAKSGGSRTIVIAAAAVGLLILSSAAVVGARKVLRAPGADVSSSASTSTASASPSATSRVSGAGSSATASSATAASGAASSAAARVEPGLCPASAVVVAGGHFTMGDEKLERARPEHGVFVDAFCLDRHEVTAEDFARCVSDGGCKTPTIDVVEDRAAAGTKSDARIKECTYGSTDRKTHPMNCVTWDEAAAYCAHVHMRLPTEAEWEYAAAGSESRAYPWGKDGPKGRVNACGPECVAFESAQKLPATPRAYDADDGFPTTAPVGSFALGDTPSGVGDLGGNVSEWANDFFAPYGEGEEVNPKGPASGAKRVVRGGSFECADDRLLAAERSPFAPESRSPVVGFRCASPLLAK